MIAGAMIKNETENTAYYHEEMLSNLFPLLFYQIPVLIQSLTFIIKHNSYGCKESIVVRLFYKKTKCFDVK